MAYSVIDKVYTIFIDVMTGSSNGYGKPTFYNTDSHTSFIELTVTNGSKEFNMTEFSYMFTVEKPDGTKYTNEYTTQDKSKLVIPVDAQMISCTGNCNAQLYVNKEVDGVNKTLTMVEFNYTVYKGLHEGLISESIDFDNVYVKILNKLDYIINNGADLTDEQAQQLATAYTHSQSPHAPANIVETMHTEIGEAIDAHHKKVTLGASQVGSYRGTDITVKPSQEGLTKYLRVRGRTLQNLCTNPLFGISDVHTNEETDTYIKSTSTDATYCYVYMNIMDGSMFKVNTEYSIIFDREDGGNSTLISMVRLEYEDGTFDDIRVIGKTGKIIMKCVPSKKVKLFRLFCYATQNEIVVGAWVKLSKEIMILEGDYTAPDAYIPPYFEGIKSVGEPTPEGGTKVVYGSHGKNLFNINSSDYGLLDSNTGNLFESDLSYTSDYIKVEKGKNYIINGEGGEIRGYYGVLYDCSKRYVAQKTFSKNTPFTFEQDGYFRFSYASEEEEGGVATNIQLEEGTEATAYEPYQEDVKEVTLPIKDGIKSLPKGVYDSVYYDNNVTPTRKGVMKKVERITFNGNENIKYSTSAEGSEVNTLRFQVPIEVKVKDGFGNNLISNFPCANSSTWASDEEGVQIYGNILYVRINKSRLATPDAEGFKAWLTANPITVYCQRENTQWISVDLPEEYELKTFNGTTHVFSKNDFKPEISFDLDFVPLTTDAKQYCTADGNKNFILPDVSALEASSAVEIHLFVEIKAMATLSFPSEILWDDSTKLSNIVQGSVAEFIFTYIKTADGGSWLGTVVPHK